MIEVLEDMPEGVVGVEAVGEVTADDYETVLIPTFEAGRAAHDHLNVVFVAGERFTGFSSGAMWDDVKWGTSHAKGWGRIALVTDVDWMRHLTKAFSLVGAEGHEGVPDQRARRGEGLGGWLSDIEMINAVTLVTADMDASCAFYDALGFERVVGGPDAPFTTYRVGDGFLNLQLDPAHAPVPAIWGRVDLLGRRRRRDVRARARGTATSPRWRRPTRRGVSATSTCATPTATSSASPSCSELSQPATVRRVPVGVGRRRDDAMRADAGAGAEGARGRCGRSRSSRGTPGAGTGRARTPRGWGGRPAACG